LFVLKIKFRQRKATEWVLAEKNEKFKYAYVAMLWLSFQGIFPANYVQLKECSYENEGYGMPFLFTCRKVWMNSDLKPVNNIV